MSAVAAPRPAAEQRRLVRVFLCDDTRELRQRVRDTLAAQGDLLVVGEADDPVDGLPLIAELQPDVVVCDLSMPRMDGLEATPRIARIAPDAGIVIFSGHLSDALSPHPWSRIAPSTSKVTWLLFCAWWVPFSNQRGSGERSLSGPGLSTGSSRRRS